MYIYTLVHTGAHLKGLSAKERKRGNKQLQEIWQATRFFETYVGRISLKFKEGKDFNKPLH